MSLAAALVVWLVAILSYVYAADPLDPMGGTTKTTAAGGTSSATTKSNASTSSSDGKFSMTILTAAGAAVGGIAIGGAIGYFCGKNKAMKAMHAEKSGYYDQGFEQGPPASGFADQRPMSQAYPRSPMPPQEEYHRQSVYRR